jgi:hypothetical protein
MEEQTDVKPAAGSAEVPARQVLKLVLGYQISGVVTVIARLKLADLLVDGPQPAGELARLTGAHPDSLLRLLRCGASLGLFTDTGGDTYALNALSDCLRTDRHSVYGVAMAAGKTAHTRPVELLYEAVMDGRSVAKDALGMEIWEYWDTDPDTRAAMTEHLVEVNEAIAPAIRDGYDLSRFHRIVDVGGNEGFFLAHLLRLAPHATGVLFDRPEVMDDARRTMASMGLADRVEFVGGDFQERIPPGGDLYVLKGILHDSSNEAAARVLDSCYAAAPPGSTLLVVEGVINGDPPLDPIVQLIDINMLIMVNGRERTLPEFDELFEASGYQRVNAIPLPSAGYWPFYLLECRRT